MTRPGISVILPTVGRDTLGIAIDSAVSQMVAGEDEIIVIGDGRQPRAEEVCKRYRRDKLKYTEYGPTNLYGIAQRNLGMSLASKEFISFMDDDDYYLPCAFDRIKSRVTVHGLHIFRSNIFGCVIWNNREIRDGNISGLCLVPSNWKEKLGKWEPRPKDSTGHVGSDFMFARDTARRMPVFWHEDIISCAPKPGYNRP